MNVLPLTVRARSRIQNSTDLLQLYSVLYYKIDLLVVDLPPTGPQCCSTEGLLKHWEQSRERDERQ